MITTKFSLFEAKGNVYQKGTPFSNGHRSRKNKDGFLLDRHLMIDLDKIIVDKSDKIVGIVEKKAQLPGPGSQFQNIIDPKVSNPQKVALLELCKRLNCKLFIQVENEKKYYLLNQDFSTREYPESSMSKSISEKSLRIVDTDNIIFIEFRKSYSNVTIKGIAERTSSDILYPYLNQISEACGGVPVFQVDDFSDDISFRVNGKLVGKVKSVLFPKSVDESERVKIEQEWESIYKKLNIWD